MKHIPFSAFPLTEQAALLAVLREAGVEPQGFCVSRVEWADPSVHEQGCGFALVTAPGLCRSYLADAGADWIQALQSDLRGQLTQACAPA